MKKYMIVFVLLFGSLIYIELQKKDSHFVTPLLLFNTAMSSIMNEEYVKLEKSLKNVKYKKNMETKEGFTLLMMASLKGDTNAIEILLKNGEDINYQTKKRKETALMLSSATNVISTVYLLKQKNINFNLENVDNNNFLHFSTINKNTDLFNKLKEKEKYKHLLKKKNIKGLTPLQLQLNNLEKNLIK